MFTKKQPTITSYILTATIGATIGAVAGILFAPKKGYKTRRTLVSSFKNASLKLPFHNTEEEINIPEPS
jgi:gas vesicle protein